MNDVIDIIQKRKSVRAYTDEKIPEKIKEIIIRSAMQAPTAGNMMLYSIIYITEQDVKERLAVTCDNQPFIAKAPLLLLFLADYQRWYDYFLYSDVPKICAGQGVPMRKPEEGDLFLACSDALIAAQTSVIAAESLGIGSCYIGDIMENYEVHRELFGLPDLVFPIALVCFGYPTRQQEQRKSPARFDKEYIVFENKYKRFEGHEFDSMFHNAAEMGYGKDPKNDNIGLDVYLRKTGASFSKEMSRSVREILKHWRPQ